MWEDNFKCKKKDLYLGFYGFEFYVFYIKLNEMLNR